MVNNILPKIIATKLYFNRFTIDFEENQFYSLNVEFEQEIGAGEVKLS